MVNEVRTKRMSDLLKMLTNCEVIVNEASSLLDECNVK